MGAALNLAGRVMLVTGGAHRVGKAICLALAGEGAHVAFTYHTSHDAALLTAGEIASDEIARDEIARLRVQSLALPCDQSDPAQIAPVVQAVLDRFGRLDGLVNSASCMPEKPFLEVTPQDWDATLAVNTRGPFFFTQAAARAMLGQDMHGQDMLAQAVHGQDMLAQAGGAIVNILDESALSPTRYYVHHSASKAALWMLTRSTALALAPTIRVNAVLPGPVLIPQGWDTIRWQRLADATPLKRLGDPADVARAVVFLMKEDFITGQVIIVDGGRTLRE